MGTIDFFNKKHFWLYKTNNQLIKAVDLCPLQRFELVLKFISKAVLVMLRTITFSLKKLTSFQAAIIGRAATNFCPQSDASLRKI